ncbi:cytochrome c oxidase subunit I [Streptomyces californicus]|uniref:cytochrome c oxidase subunit I n=1 Tax=Streptomyces californicus TaxID=67351 RepID=UPI000B30592E|nr:cbb3-type cytochrome c oxidase subunit I [Streptomyces californicus]
MTTRGISQSVGTDTAEEDELPVRGREPGNVVVKWMTTTDHKTIGTLYLVTSFAFFCVGGLLALVMRAELARPGIQLLSNEQFNQAFTMHGTIMLLMFATPLFAGFANWINGSGLLRLRHDPRLGQLHHHDHLHARPALLWQHLFWFFGHPEVYIIALPFFGIVTEIFPVFSRKPVFGYIGLVAATIAIAGLSATVWAHHMFVTGGVLLPFFSFMTFLIAVPTGVKFFNWIGTMWKGSISMETPMLWAVGFLVTFLFGGLTGIILASPPMDFHVSDSYFVVAHFHYVVFGTVVFAMFAGFHFWWPKFTGKMLDERLGKITFWTLFVGFHGTFLVQHWLGAEGMPRRYADYLDADGFTALNTISSISSFLLGLSMLPFFYNIWKTAKYGKKIEVDDPWGYGRSLEWATSCPPPRHNFVTLPRIRSESPAFDLHHPTVRALADATNRPDNSVVVAPGDQQT